MADNLLHHYERTAWMRYNLSAPSHPDLTRLPLFPFGPYIKPQLRIRVTAAPFDY